MENQRQRAGVSRDETRSGGHTRVISPRGIDRFDCTGCGRCCRLWGVSIDTESFRRTEKFLASPPEPRPNADRPWFTENEGRRQYNLTEEGSCVFLDAENRCYLHRFDPTLKSTVCRTYPFENFATARGVERSMSFASFGAFQRVLLDPAPFAIEETAAPPGFAMPAVSDRPIASQPSVSWKALFLLERALIDHLAVSASVDDALVSGARFLAAAEAEGSGLEEALASDRLQPASFGVSSATSDLDQAYRLLEQFLNLRIGLARHFPGSAKLEVAVTDLARDVERGPIEDGVGRALFYRRLRRFSEPSFDALAPVYRKQIQFLVFRKSIFLHHGLVRGWNVLCLLYALARLRLMLSARAAKRAPTVEDLFEPMAFVNRYFLHADSFLKFWQDAFTHPVLGAPELAEIIVRL